MTIDINELRRLMQDFKLAGSPMLVQTAQMSELLDRLEAAEKSDAESIAMYRKARDERDALRAENAALVDDMNLLRNNNTALRAKIETAENNAAHQKALAASALRVAEGWERKYDDLRVKVAEMEQQEPVGVLHVGSYYGEELQDWEFEANQCACDKLNEAYVRNPMSLPLYALPGAQPAWSSQAVLDITAERRRQIEVECWTPEHDDEHRAGEMAKAAACYALVSAGFNPDAAGSVWPWRRRWWKPSDKRRDLIKAGALILAEVERLDRAAEVGRKMK